MGADTSEIEKLIKEGQEQNGSNLEDFDVLKKEIRTLLDKAQKNTLDLVSGICDRMGVGEESRNKILEFFKNGENLYNAKDAIILTELLEKGEISKEDFDLFLNIKNKYEQYENLVEATILANESLPNSIENLPIKEKKKLKIENIEKFSMKDQELVNGKLDREIQNTFAKVFSCFKGSEYPYGLIGSGAFVLNAKEKTNKEPEDGDFVSAIQNFSIFKENVSNLEKTGVISSLKIIAMTDLEGKKNGCYEVQGFVNNEKSQKPFSVFFQNINPEKSPNGFVNIGLEQLTFHKYKIAHSDGSLEEGYFIDDIGNEKLYSRNTLNEITLFMINDYGKNKTRYPYMSPKGLQRLSNLAILNNFDFKEVLDKLAKEVSSDNKQQKAFRFLNKLRKEFLKGRLNGEGLANSLCGEDVTNCMELAVDKITKEIKIEMQTVYEHHLKAENIYNNQQLKSSEKMQLISQIGDFISKIYDKCSDKLKMINPNDNNDFIPFIALKTLENDFLWRAVVKCWNYKDKLSKQILKDNI